MSTGAMVHAVDNPETFPDILTESKDHLNVPQDLPEQRLTAADFRRKFTVAEFVKLDELDFFGDDEYYELIDGDLIPMGRIQGPHSACINRLNLWLPVRVGDRGNCQVQNPISISETSQPQPDFAIAHRQEDGYPGIPRASDLFLAIEVMDSSVRKDRQVKLPLYATAGIPETWLINIPSLLIERHRLPVNGAYTERVILYPGSFIATEAFPDIVLSVSRIFGIPASESKT